MVPNIHLRPPLPNTRSTVNHPLMKQNIFIPTNVFNEEYNEIQEQVQDSPYSQLKPVMAEGEDQEGKQFESDDSEKNHKMIASETSHKREDKNQIQE